MRKLALLIGLLPCLTLFGQGYKVYRSDGQVDAYRDETAVSVSLNDDSLRYNGHEYVDLGLPSGTRWATTNVGAMKCNQNGLHFTFEHAKTDGQWGGDWRMPGIPEYQELLRVCQWEWTKEGVSQGYMVTGPNGNKLFLPAAGYIKPDGSFAGGLTGQLAGYWTSEGYSLCFSPSAKGLSAGGSLQLSLRPVIGGQPIQDVRSEVVNDGPHDCVDLGLSVLWATTNIGADTPEAYGDYFAPGCTEPMPYSLGELSPFRNSDYIYENFYLKEGYEDEYRDLTVWSQLYMWGGNLYECGYWLLPEHDAATALWGDGWRMPTLSEYKELLEKSTKSGSSYVTFRGPNGNTLTLPRAGYYDYGGYFQSGAGYYMTSSILRSFPMMVDITQRNINSSRESEASCFCPIRPVKDKPKAGLTDEATTAQQEMVDLGLSVLWANSNWGAATPKDKGEYVACGETYPKAEYTSANYHPADSYTPQGMQTMLGKSGWMLPTTENVQELIDNCTWTREADGYRVTGPNGNSIFLPYTGFRESVLLNFPNELGMYRTQGNQVLQLRSTDGEYRIADANDYAGMAVRPVAVVSIETEEAIATNYWESSYDMDFFHHSASFTVKAIGKFKDFGIQLCYVKNMDNFEAGAWKWTFKDESDGPWNNETVFSLKGEYSRNTDGLQPNTTYYYRAYAITENDIELYDNIKQLHITDEMPAIDLGLSVKWAPCNIGSSWPRDVMDYYTLSYIADTGKQLPSIFDGWGGTTRAPQTYWSEEWRLPTEAEFQELIDNCTWEWIEGGYCDSTYYAFVWNNNGYRVTGPNGNSIILLANGAAIGGSPTVSSRLYDLGEIGYYWTQTPSSHAGCNKILKFTATDKKIYFGPTNAMYNIRPVKK